MKRSASSDQPAPRPAVFLDRDGVLNEDVGYAHRADQLTVLPGVAAALRELARRGFLLIVVSNQSGVARGMFDVDAVESFHAALTEELARQGAKLDAILYCPHHPDGVEGPYRQSCSCRKPEPGMLLEAAKRFGIDLPRSYLVGDKDSDVDCAEAAGVIPIQVAARGAATHPRARAVVGSLEEALPHLVRL